MTRCLPLLCSLLVLTVGTVRGDDGLLLDRVQRNSLRHFWERGHPVSGMALERTSTRDTVTTGGTGFGLMAMLVGVERGWIPRERFLARVCRIVRFLERSDRCYGAWPHWLDGRTGRCIPFSPRDDGADLVETSFLLQGLLCMRQYFHGDSAGERGLRRRIDALWRAVDWQAFRRPEGPVLSWHRSPRHGFSMKLPVEGWNEALLVYVLASGAPDHAIDPRLYHQGWAKGRHFLNGQRLRGIRLPLGPPGGGPLFFAHYSFLGLDPRGLRDRYADYWQQNLAHVDLNRAHCLAAPARRGYGPDCWGLSASDTPGGYAAHSPTNDLGVISPTAALASMPYRPEAVMPFLRRLLRDPAEGLFDAFGPVDAFQPSTGWRARDRLAIDQGPIVVGIENHRSALLWKLFMSCPEVCRGLERLGFERNLHAK